MLNIEIKQSKEERTKELLKHWRDRKDECQLLAGVLSMTFSIPERYFADKIAIRNLYDLSLIAQRLDELAS